MTKNNYKDRSFSRKNSNTDTDDLKGDNNFNKMRRNYSTQKDKVGIEDKKNQVTKIQDIKLDFPSHMTSKITSKL